MTDLHRAAIIAFVQSLFPVLILLGVIQLTDQQIAAIMLAVGNSLTLLMLVWKQGQQAEFTSGDSKL